MTALHKFVQYIYPSASQIHHESNQVKPNASAMLLGDRAHCLAFIWRLFKHELTLYLTRQLKKATLVRVATSQVVAGTMLAEKIEVAAGVTQQLQADAKRVADVRLLAGTFMTINQAWLCRKEVLPDSRRCQHLSKR